MALVQYIGKENKTGTELRDLAKDIYEGLKDVVHDELNQNQQRSNEPGLR